MGPRRLVQLEQQHHLVEWRKLVETVVAPALAVATASTGSTKNSQQEKQHTTVGTSPGEMIWALHLLASAKTTRALLTHAQPINEERNLNFRNKPIRVLGHVHWFPQRETFVEDPLWIKPTKMYEWCCGFVYVWSKGADRVTVNHRLVQGTC